ncbi:uncharacterized protein N7511_006263 [Penicillium nucicola]|uniref:uncharacterized protein n=1 Tax=Penicillium nucicola TaxID=1850975 RepID=UPI002545A2B9|nr:uncharacterized protein N7511_006263 [Penicillium nucicola]KAJ5757569.1 hypothetical protein N7511_006263 [Penicillium nucicola]
MRLLWQMCSLTHFVSLVSADSDFIGTWCDICLPVTIPDAPGLSFDLTPLYGTAVVHYFNGTVVEVAKIPGNPEYLELVAHLTIPKPLLKSTLNYMLSGISLPKRVVAVERLVALAEPKNRPTDKSRRCRNHYVAVTEPGFQTFSSATFNAALRVIGLRTWVHDSIYYPSRLVEGDVVYAASGYGLRIKYLNRFECVDEFANSPTPTDFVISYNHNLLYSSIMGLATSEAFPYISSLRVQLVD